MEPLKLLKFLRDDIYEKSIAGSYLSAKEANEVIETLRSFIESLRGVRNSNELTKKELQKINELPGKISPGIKFWLFKLLADDDSFSRAYDLISKEISTKQLVYIPQKNLSDAEILEIIEVEERLNETDTPINQAVDHSRLLIGLKRYIEGINATEFTNIIEKHSISTGTPPAKWIGKAVDAHRFATFIGMKISLWNKCFTGLKDKSGNARTLKDGDKDKTEWNNAPIIEILRTYLDK